MEFCLEAMGLSPDRRAQAATEEALVERCRRRDVEAFGKIVDAYQSRVFGFVRRMVGDGEDASDIAQEVFIRAFQSIHRFDGRSSVRTWLFRIAHNLCVDRARRSRRSPAEMRLDAFHGEEEPFEIADHRGNPEGAVLDDELALAMEQGIASLSDKLRSVLLLHDRDDLSYEQIAEVLGVPVGTVKSRLFLARAHLQAVMKAYVDPKDLE
ncbi:MAG: sigma-70 family RNA polymerase sigma factor [Fimbriimonadaceae bacterium]|nr:sigma-70 family RNA polymerase sigma factor [Fimbriimonadaceae bacterium]